MAKKTTSGKIKSQVACPQCGGLSDCETWKKDYTVFEELVCPKCRIVWGRSPTGSRQWHILERIRESEPTELEPIGG